MGNEWKSHGRFPLGGEPRAFMKRVKHKMTSNGYPPANKLFEILAKAALCYPRHSADPLTVFDDIESVVRLDASGTVRQQVLDEWRRRSIEFPWYIPDKAGR